jgi:hypothetical protein
MRIISEYAFRIIQVEGITEASGRNIRISVIELVRLNPRCIIGDRANKAILPVKPPKDPKIIGL